MLRFSRKTFRRKKTEEKPTLPSEDIRKVDATPTRRTPSSNIAIVVPTASEERKKKEEAEITSPATGTSPVVKDSFQYPSKYFENRILQPTWLVQTPYGVGTVVACRAYVPGGTDDDEKDDEETLFDDRTRASGYKYHIRIACDSDSVSPCSRLVTFENYPSIEPEIGSEVVLTCFHSSMNDTLQRGRVVNLRPNARQAVVRLVTWRLVRQTPPITVTISSKRSKEGGAFTELSKKRYYPTVSFVTCYLGYESIQVVSPKSVEDMNAYETLLYVYERQHLAYEQYVARHYATCCDLYESAITAIRSLLFDKQLSEAQTVRGNLILTQIRCCNQAAICCLHMSNYQGVIGHAMSALKMLRAMEKKREMSYALSSNASSSGLSSECEPATDQQERRQLDRLCGELRVFGVWRIKAMQLLTLALVKFSQWEHAKEICLQAHKIIVKYTTQSPPSASNSRRSVFRDYLHRKSQLLHVDKSLLRLYARIEQKRGGRMNMTDRSIVVVDQECSDDGDGVSTLDDIDAEWLDEDEEQDMAKDWQPLAVVVGQLPSQGSILLFPSRKEDSDSVVTEGSCELSCGRTTGVDFRVEELPSVNEDDETKQGAMKPDSVGAQETSSHPSPRALHHPLGVTMTSDSDDSLYEGTAKISPSSLEVKAETICTAKPRTGESEHDSERSLGEWEEVDLDATMQIEDAADARDDEFPSAVVIQALVRGVLVRRAWWVRHMKLSIAACTIQSWLRCILERRSLQPMLLFSRIAATKLQSVHRGQTERRRYHLIKSAVRTMQDFTRASLVRLRSERSHKVLSWACAVLQARYRGRIQHQHYLRQRDAAITIQAFCRFILTRSIFIRSKNKMEKAVEVIETWYRASIDRRAKHQYIEAVATAAIKVQRLYRRHRDLNLYLLQINSAIHLQSLARSMIAQKRLKQTNDIVQPACALIQARFRGNRVRREFLKERMAVTKLQSVVRSVQVRRRFHQSRKSTMTAVTKIQLKFRRSLECRKRRRHLRCIVLSQAGVRSWLARRRLAHLRLRLPTAAVCIQAWQRKNVRLAAYQRMRRASVILQAFGRGAQTRRSYAERKRVIEAAAIKIQSSFRRCVDIQRYKKEKSAATQYARSLHAALRLQRFARQLVVAIESELQRDSTQKIQVAYRRHRHRVMFLRKLQSAIATQSLSRGHLARTRFAQLKAIAITAATRIQTCYRSVKERRRYENLRKSVRHLQVKVRDYQACRKLDASRTDASIVLQAWARGGNTRRYVSHSARAATRIAALHRGATQRRKYVALKDATRRESDLSTKIIALQKSLTVPEALRTLEPDLVKDDPMEPGKKAEDSTSDVETMSQATNQCFETASHASDVSEVASLNSGRFSMVSAPVHSSRAFRSKASNPAPRKAFVDPETLRRLKSRTITESPIPKVPAPPSMPSTAASHRSSPSAAIANDDISVVSDDASQITSASAYYDAASQISGGDASDAGDSVRSGRSRASAASGYSRFSVVSAPAFVRSEMGKVKDRHGNVTSTRKVFVDSATLKKLQRRSRPKVSSNSSASSYRRKPFITPDLLDELTEGASMASVREQGKFEPVYEEPPDDTWRDEIKVFAPAAKKKKAASKADKHRRGKTTNEGDVHVSSGASVGGASVGGTSVGGSSVNRRVSFARDVVFSEDFHHQPDGRFDDAHAATAADDDDDTSTNNNAEARRPRRRAWYQTREFQAGVGTLVASGASIGTLIASKFMKGR
jgi:IQ calmodulin-binding motif